MTKLTILFPIVMALCATGCKNHRDHGSKPQLQAPAQRDLTINKGNAYNDLFLDSLDVEKFIAAEKLNDTLSAAMRSFYDARNFEYAWFAGNGLIEQAVNFHSLYSTSTEGDDDVFNKSMETRLNRIRAENDTVIDAKDTAIIKIELQLSLRFIRYALANYKSENISAAELGTYVPAKKKPVSDVIDSMLANTEDNKAYTSINESYRLLRGQLQKYEAIAKSGGWPVITVGAPKYSIGKKDPVIALIKKRLQISGELAGSDTSGLFDPELETAVKTYQQSHGYTPTGIVTASLVKDMNVPVAARMQQLVINMQRMRWMPTRTEGRLIIVNIPEFEVYVDSGKTTLFQMGVVVGAEGHNTTMFSGNINQIVFSPYWDIPPSIVKKEVLPGMKRDKDYLAKRDMEITGHEGSLPVVRQKPGDKNALGKVKFLFPNSFNIYLHDSPEKGLFNKTERDLSHGCIRLSDAPKMVHYLLQNSETWPPEKIDSAMNSGVEQFVKLRPTVPVIITYYTAWVDDTGALHFAGDIYGHDSMMAQKMFTDPQ